ncbi:hypothetical protein D3C72_1743800 [compost metagenome]
MPDFHPGLGQRLAVAVEHLPFHHQYLAVIGAIVQAGLALGDRGAGHVKRSFDGARRAARDAGARFGLVHAQVEEVIKAKPGRDQAEFAGAACLGQVVEPGPELFGLDVEVVDHVEQVAHHPVHDGGDARVGVLAGAFLDAVEHGVDCDFVHGCLLGPCG